MVDSVFYVVRIAQVPFRAPVEEKESRSRREPAEADRGTSLDETSVEASQSSRNAWLFQSNPLLYDLRGALGLLREQVWSVSRFSKEIRTGDRVYLWEAGRRGGIAAVAEIREPARPQPEPTEQLRFARDAGAFAGDRLRARLRILQVIDPVIPRQSVASNPELSALGVLRCSRGTNFRLSLEEWQALNDLILGAAALMFKQLDSSRG